MVLVNKLLIYENSDLNKLNNIYTYSKNTPSPSVDANSNWNDTLSIDIKSMFPAKYTQYTSDDFIFVTTGIAGWSDRNNDNTNSINLNISINYDNSTGVLTITGLGQHVGGSDDLAIRVIRGYILLTK